MIAVIWHYKSITAMKKLTGTILLATALFAHVGIIVATEESYIFSAADHQTSPVIKTTGIDAALTAIPAGGQPLFTSTVDHTGMFSVEEAFFTF